MTQISTLIMTFAALTTFKVGVVLGTCRYPDFLLRSEPWVGDYKDGQLIAYVNPSFIKARESFDGAATDPFHKECVKRGPDNKFVVRLRQQGQPIQYQCLQFLKRSNNIVQIKKSGWYDRQHVEMCREENMEMDPFPWVQLGQEEEDDLDCPFVGGYNFYAYYPRPNNSLVCSNNRLLMRMESECELGGGIEFNFRKEYCVPRGLPRNPIQKAKCVAHWTQDGYTFIILRHTERAGKWWCMRTEDPLSGLKNAYLWMQVVCDATPEPNPDISLNYLRLGFQRVVYSSTCADEIQVCQEAQHCDANFRQHCALTCRQCRSENEIGLCTFEEQFRGRWMDSGQNGDYIMDVETYTIRGKNMGTYNCLMLDNDVQEYKDKKFLLETYDNGCLPRYACAEMRKVNSSVMQFRIGDRHVWPLPAPTLKMGAQIESQKEYICKANNFQIHYRAESKYIKERPPRLIVNTEDTRELPCGIPPELQNGIAFEEDGRRCGGCLYYNPSNNLTRFVIRPENCEDKTATTTPGPAEFQNLPISYSCMASFSFHTNASSVITKTTSFNTGMGQYLMWTFKNNQIKVMKASEAFVYQHNEHPKSEYIQAQFSILQYDKYKCRMNTYHPTPPTTTTTTSTTTPINEHWIDHRPRTTPGPHKGKDGKYTLYPDRHPDKSNITPYSQSENLRDDNGGGSSSVFRCNDSVYVILFMTSLAISKVTFNSFGNVLSLT